MKKQKELPTCPVAVTAGVIGSKWKLLILRNLSSGSMRFNELRASLDGISKKVLSSTLRSMDEDGIVVRQVYPEYPVSVVYKLSALGVSLKPVLDAMAKWGDFYRALREKTVSGAMKEESSCLCKRMEGQ